MTLDPRHFSMRAGLIFFITSLLAVIALALVMVFPARMDAFARRWGERRAIGMAIVLSNAAAAGLEFDDAKTVHELLAGLGTAPEVTYATVRRADGSIFAAHKPALAPKDRVAVSDEPIVGQDQNELRVDAPVRGKAGSAGTLTIGFSLDELRRDKREIRSLVLVLSGLLLLFGIAVSWILGTVMAKPVVHMIDVMKRVASGDLSQNELSVGTKNEIGGMAEAFNQMLRTLRVLASTADRMAQGNLVGQVSLHGQVADSFNRMLESQRTIVRQMAESAAELGSAAAEIYAASQGQEASATKQSAGVEEISRTMQSLLDSASHIAESARGVFSNAERTKETANGMVKQIAELSRHTSRIGELLEVIRDIADRSDLLALNASLEATRAGESGRSFSLVAGEMRRLAERVTATVQDVKALVNDVQSSGTSTVMATEEGRKLADNTTESARQITLVTQQQRTATEQVSAGMTNISALLAQTAVAAAQTRGSTEVLKAQADRLNEIVGRFKVAEVDVVRRSAAG